ncbi:MAG: hypothetical protein QM831_34850 [Kofleriaceae bacterium]
MRWSLLVLVACHYDATDYAGKACPCPSGYSCVANACIAGTIEADAAIDAPDYTTSCLASPLENLVYSNATFADYPTSFTAIAGAWGDQPDGLHQGNESLNLAAIALNGIPGNGANEDYRVVVKAAGIAGADGGAFDVALRVSATNKTMYQCGLVPAMNQIVLARTDANSPDIDRETVAGDLSLMQTYILEAQVTGSQIECCVRGVEGAHAMGTDTTFSGGPPGLKTYMMSAVFSDYAVFQ